MVGYRVYLMDDTWGNKEKEEVFTDLKSAKSYWHHLINERRAEAIPLKRNDDYYSERSNNSYWQVQHGDKISKGVVYKRKRNLRKNEILKAIIPYWEKCSYECDEWDIEQDFAVVEKIVIHDLK